MHVSRAPWPIAKASYRRTARARCVARRTYERYAGPWPYSRTSGSKQEHQIKHAEYPGPRREAVDRDVRSREAAVSRFVSRLEQDGEYLPFLDACFDPTVILRVESSPPPDLLPDRLKCLKLKQFQIGGRVLQVCEESVHLQDAFVGEAAGRVEIGRASCRERV